MTATEPPTFAKIGVTPAFIANRLRIFLDAVPQSGVLEYDTEAGYLVRYVVLPTPAGSPTKFKVAGDEVETERVEGIVEVMWKDGP